jgi:glycosyltransferase involved in cell wall biosynthesis
VNEPRHVHFVQSLEPLQGGGLGNAARQLHQAMRENNLPSILVATRDKNFLEHWEHVTQCIRAGPSKAFYAWELRKVAKSLAGPGCVIHGHGLYVYPNWVFGQLARTHRLPLVYHVHGFFEPWILGHSRGKKRLAHWLFEDANFRQVRLWRALTSREADQIREVIGADAKIVVAPNGMDLTPIKQATFSRVGGRKRALFLGRLHPKKGLDLLIRAWAQQERNAKEWELVIAGPDEGGHAAHVRSWVKTAGLEDSITFVGPVSGGTKYELIASADLFVLTSYSEGLPMAPLEAMAAGVPVLLTQECNLPEAASAGAGWFAKAELSNVSDALAQAMGASDAEIRERGATGRALVERDFTWKKTVAALTEACNQIR